MSGHAILSPSSAQRWLNCTPSARLELQFPDKGSAAADEGTLAHALGELVIRRKLNRIQAHVFEIELAKIVADKLYDHAMSDHAEDYAVFVLERFADAVARTKDAQIALEVKVDLTDYIEEGSGTVDVRIVADYLLEIIDLKYGKGVLVDADQNRQMMLYALGALRDADSLYDIEQVRMTIYQPRLGNFSSFQMSVADLRKWAEEELKPRAALAFAGKGDFAPGKHCRFCKAAPVCKANADMNLEVAKYDFADPNLLTDEEISDILDRADGFQKWLESVEGYALDQAVNHDKHWPGYKLVEGRGTRKYTDEEAIAAKLKEQGFEEDKIAPRSLLGITNMTKEIGKKAFDTFLTDFIIKPPGKLTLAPLSDKRPEHNSTASAAADFA